MRARKAHVRPGGLWGMAGFARHALGSWCTGGAHGRGQEMQEIQEIQERPCGASSKPFCRAATAAVLEVLWVLYVLLRSVVAFPGKHRNAWDGHGSEALCAER